MIPEPDAPPIVADEDADEDAASVRPALKLLANGMLDATAHGSSLKM
jgi:hypothetical protein